MRELAGCAGCATGHKRPADDWWAGYRANCGARTESAIALPNNARGRLTRELRDRIGGVGHGMRAVAGRQDAHLVEKRDREGHERHPALRGNRERRPVRLPPVGDGPAASPPRGGTRRRTSRTTKQWSNRSQMPPQRTPAPLRRQIREAPSLPNSKPRPSPDGRPRLPDSGGSAVRLRVSPQRYPTRSIPIYAHVRGGGASLPRFEKR